MKKKIGILTIIIFWVIILLPMLFMNREENAISEIDNKYLAPWPFSADAEGDLTDNIESYISERIGFRDKAILSYTVANDRLFGEMVHPTYTYGKDGFIFLKYTQNKSYGSFEDSFVHMLSEIQKYCDDRNIPFIFLFEPGKASVYPDKLAEGYNYSDAWVSVLREKLEEAGIRYVDNTDTLKEIRKMGIDGFNVKFNAGHWNDTGAFYGMNAAFRALADQGAKVHINTEDDFRVVDVLKTSLLVSEFPIKEYIPVYRVADQSLAEFALRQMSMRKLSEEYGAEVERDEAFRTFVYSENEKRMEEGCDRVLVFQGSYINGMGHRFLQNSFSEYVGVHDYQNVLDFDYYFNIFKPDCVIVEAAQYTFSDSYFDSARMKDISFNPLFSTFDGYTKETSDSIRVEITEGDLIDIITVTDDTREYDLGYLIVDGEEYDLKKEYDDSLGGYRYTVSIEKSSYKKGAVVSLIDLTSGTKAQSFTP